MKLVEYLAPNPALVGTHDTGERPCYGWLWVPSPGEWAARTVAQPLKGALLRLQARAGWPVLTISSRLSVVPGLVADRPALVLPFPSQSPQQQCPFAIAGPVGPAA